MNKLLILLWGLSLLATAQAQQSTGYNPEYDARERARIAAERQQAMERYGQEEADCYQRFAVNDCLRAVRKRRRVGLEELRRQEIILNDERRAAAAAAAQQRVDQRAAERAGAPAAEPGAAAQKEQGERLPLTPEQQLEPQNRPSAPTPAVSAPQQAPTPAESAAEAARRQELQREYQEKQRRADERRQEHERAKSEKGPGTSRPLPVPP